MNELKPSERFTEDELRQDPDVQALIARERERQDTKLEEVKAEVANLKAQKKKKDDPFLAANPISGEDPDPAQKSDPEIEALKQQVADLKARLERRSSWQAGHGQDDGEEDDFLKANPLQGGTTAEEIEAAIATLRKAQGLLRRTGDPFLDSNPVGEEREVRDTLGNALA